MFGCAAHVISLHYKNIAFWSSVFFQNLISWMNRYLDTLNDVINIWLLNIFILVLVVGSMIIFKKAPASISLNSTLLEVTWTVIPIIILVRIAFPRILLLCSQDFHQAQPVFTVKVIRNQWNWQTDRVELIDHLVDSEKMDELSRFDYPLFLSEGLIRFLLTRRDVLHSLGLPSLGVKLDSNPGRLNSTSVDIISKGIYLGSCYELCGRGHRAIPIFILVN